MSVTIKHQPRSTNTSSIIHLPSTSQHNYQGRSQQSSTDIENDGCCLVTTFLSNMLSFRIRRRKTDVHKESRNTINQVSKKPGISLSQANFNNKIRRASQSEQCIADSFNDEMLDKLTAIPYGVDGNEWLATHTLALFENVNALCGTVGELCTPVSCSTMSYPGVQKAYFIDEHGKRHQYSAMQYIDSVMTFCERSRKNEAIFPTKYGNYFLPEFKQHCRKILILLWHCCGHLYTKHWDHLAALNLRPQFSLVLAHISRIIKIFNLMDSKELKLLIKTLGLVRPPYSNEVPKKKFAGSEYQPQGNVESLSKSSRMPTAKSGSWGGHPTPSVSSCKPPAQTY